jgi:predicted nucleotidyltransferase
MEWLESPIVYQEEFAVAAQMRDLMSRHYSPVACLYHYLHMARGNYRDYLKRPTVWVKKYFDVLLESKQLEREYSEPAGPV